MPFSYQQVLVHLKHAVETLFRLDECIQGVGITQRDDTFGFIAVRRTETGRIEPNLRRLFDIPVFYVHTDGFLQALAATPPGAGPVYPEQLKQDPLYCGVQIQNSDFITRNANTAFGTGTLGCFVELDNGSTGLLTCSHVIGGSGSFRRRDRIMQPGGTATSYEIAKLYEHVPLIFSDPSATDSTAFYNTVDAAVAELNKGVRFDRSFLPDHKWDFGHNVPQISGTAIPNPGDEVIKVGRSTSYTEGIVIGTDLTNRRCLYGSDLAWFADSFLIEGSNRVFAQLGDSGAAILLKGSDKVLGILYAMSGPYCWAYPISFALNELKCSLA